MKKTTNLVLAALFLIFAGLQYNDPDPWRWALMYSYVAVVCGFAAFNKQNKNVIWAGVAACLIWLAIWLPDFLNWIKIGAPNIAQQMKSETPYIEYSREFFGLVICLLALGWQLWSVRKKQIHTLPHAD